MVVQGICDSEAMRRHEYCIVEYKLKNSLTETRGTKGKEWSDSALAQASPVATQLRLLTANLSDLSFDRRSSSSSAALPSLMARLSALRSALGSPDAYVGALNDWRDFL